MQTLSKLSHLHHLSRHAQDKVDFHQFALDPANPGLGVSRRAPLFYKSGGVALWHMTVLTCSSLCVTTEGCCNTLVLDGKVLLQWDEEG